jgi:hypothetical protein
MTFPSSSTVLIFCSIQAGRQAGRQAGSHSRCSAVRTWRQGLASPPTAGRPLPQRPSLPPFPPAAAHKVYADGRDVALCVGVILQDGGSGSKARVSCRSCKQRGLRARRPRLAPPPPAAPPPPLLTANRSSRHDLPTPESPMSRSCKRRGGGRGEVVSMVTRVLISQRGTSGGARGAAQGLPGKQAARPGRPP